MRRRELRYSTRGASVNKSRAAPGFDALRHADPQGLRGRERHGMALTIRHWSMAQANVAALFDSHAIVLWGAIARLVK